MTEKHDGKLTVGDTNVDLPRVASTVGNDGLSIATVLRDTETVTYDPGFMNTANAQSAVTSSMVKPAFCATAVTRLKSWPKTRPSWKWPTCSFTANCPPQIS